MFNTLANQGLIDRKIASFVYDSECGYIYATRDSISLLNFRDSDLEEDERGYYVTYENMLSKYVEQVSADDFEKMLAQAGSKLKTYPVKFVNISSCIVLNGAYVKAKEVYYENKRYVVLKVGINHNWYTSCPSVMTKFTVSMFTGLKNKYALYNSSVDVFKNSKVYMIVIGNYHLLEREHGDDTNEIVKRISNEIVKYGSWEKTFQLEKNQIVILGGDDLDTEKLHDHLNTFVGKITRGIDVFISLCSIDHDAFEYDSIGKFFYHVDIFISNTLLEQESDYLHIDKKTYDDYKKGDVINKFVIDAVREGNIEVAYQPKVCLVTNRVIGFEALLRTDIYDMSISTDKFINICNNNGLITMLDSVVLVKALEMFNKIKDSGYDMEGFIMATNITPESLPKINVDSIEKLVEDAGIPKEAVEFELLEEVVANDAQIEVLKELIKRGFRVAIDDFSAGHSSLKYLFKIDPSTVKFDKTLLPDMNNDKEKLIYRYIAELCRSLGFTTISEGVETEEELEYMKELGIDMVQGFYFSKALKDNEFINYCIETDK